MRPTTARLADTAAHHQKIDDPPVVHVHMVPVVEAGPEDHHRLAIGGLGISGEFARYGNDGFGGNAGDLLCPGRGIRRAVAEIARDMFTAQAPVEAVIGAKQVKDCCDKGSPVLELQFANRDALQEHIGVIGALEMIVFAVAEIREGNLDHLVVVLVEDRGHPQFDLVALAVLFLEVPLAFLAPAEARAARWRNHIVACLVDRDCLPFGVVLLAKITLEIAGAQQALGNQPAILFDQPDQHRHVRVAATIVLEIGHLPVEVELAQDHVAHRHGQCGIGALLGIEPEVRELGRLGIVGADHRNLGAAIARLGHEMGIGRAGLRDVRSPHHQKARIVPVGTFWNVGLFAPGHRARRRQIAIPVIERHAGPAEQREIARTRRVGDHRHGRDRRESDHPVGPPLFGGIGIGRGDDLVHLVPGGTHEAAVAADRGIALALVGVGLDRGPGRNRGHGCARCAPQLDQPFADQRILQPLGRIDVPGVARPARAAARLVIGKFRTGSWIVGLLGFPGDNPALYVDLPRTRSGAVHPVR